MTQLEYLLDTLEYYSVNPKERRSFILTEQGRPICKYAPVKETSEGCAIGRKLTGTTEQKQAWDKSCASYMSIVSTYLNPINDIVDIRPEWMKDMSPRFLQELQRFHDTKLNWASVGLTREGKYNLKSILEEYAIPMGPFEKYLSNNVNPVCL